tara:strand:- start:660 stop:818 length:159 start_codon:yes stop_codon:yes gene_type:complete
MTLTEHILIEEILAEANAHGLKEEVQRWAYKFLDEGYDIETAYQMAFQEWCK